MQTVPTDQPANRSIILFSTADLHDGVSITSRQRFSSVFFHQVAEVLDPTYIGRHNHCEGSPGSGTERIYSVHGREQGRV